QPRTALAAGARHRRGARRRAERTGRGRVRHGGGPRPRARALPRRPRGPRRRLGARGRVRAARAGPRGRGSGPHGGAHGTSRLGGAALDVRVVEPPPAEDRFARLDNVLLTPHLAGLSAEAQARIAGSVLADVRRVLGGRAPRGPAILP